MKLLSLFLVAFFALCFGRIQNGEFPTESNECICSQNQTIFAAVVSVTIRDPSIGGLLGAYSCATNCVTSINFIEEFTNCLLPAASVTLAQCSGLNGNNYVEIYGGDELAYNLTQCPSPSTSLIVTFHVINFNFHLQAPISTLIVLQPIQNLSTTASSFDVKPTGNKQQHSLFAAK